MEAGEGMEIGVEGTGKKGSLDGWMDSLMEA